MSIQHINSVIDYNWPEYHRRFPAFDKPQIVPAESLRGMAPIYMRNIIDQDPNSYYLFVHADPMRGDASRDRMKEFIDDLFTNKLRMPSSYEANEGYSHEEAIDKEILPAENNREFRSYYDEQMARMDAQRREEERQRRIDNLGFDPDDPDIIDAEVIEPDGSSSGGPQQRSTAVGKAQSTAVGAPKRIWYAIDFHVNAGAMLGYNGNNTRLGGRRRPGGYLREANSNEEMHIIDKLLYVYKRIIKDNINSNIESIATPEIESSDWKLFLIKYIDGLYGRFYINKEKTKYGNPIIVEPYRQKKETKQEIQNNLNYYQKRGINFIVFTKDELDQMVATENSYVNESDPEKMMKEFTETSDMDEDDMLKNRPHNLHKDEKLLESDDLDEDDDVLEDDDLEECDDLTEDTAETEELEEDDEVTEKDESELNESLINFSARLIRG